VGSNIRNYFKSFRLKVLLGFLSLLTVLISCIAIYFFINKKQSDLNNFLTSITDIRNHFLENQNKLQLFTQDGYKENSFYVKKDHKYLSEFKKNIEDNIISLQNLEETKSAQVLDIKEDISELIQLNKNIITIHDSLKNLYLIIGYDDYGLEGKMKTAATLVADKTEISFTDLQLLKNNEKDYLREKDKDFALQFNSTLSAVIKKYNKQTEKSALLNYQKAFNELVNYNDRLGINTVNSVQGNLNSLINKMVRKYNLSIIKSSQKLHSLHDQFFTILIVATIFLVLLGVYLSLYLSKKLTTDLSTLEARMESLMQSNFTDDPKDDDLNNPKDMGHLNNQFTLLKNTLKETISDLENSYQKAKISSESKGIFLANMSHEIRTPLNGVIGMIHILKETELRPEQADYLETLEFSAQHLLELINTILDYSKIEAGKMEVENIPFNLEYNMQKILRIFEYKTTETNLKISLSFEAENLRYLIGDPLKIQQIIINLLNNAVKFTEKGSVTVKVKEVSDNEKWKEIMFAVEDTGIGIHPDKIQPLFEAFEQGDSSTTRNYGGTGLGLTIAKQMVKLLKGSLEVESEVNKGSRFYFTLKLKKGDFIPVKQSFEKTASDSEKGVIDVLLAEDNVINQKVISIMMKKHNVNIDIANNGEEALDFFNKKDYDLIFMDVQMPVMDGLKATKLIKESAKYQVRKTPIIAITANAFNDDKNKAFDAGMNYFLSKPLNPFELSAIFSQFNQILQKEKTEE
jgi:signal transduction histidine kinase/CheY-like chemotaxis protein